MTHRQRGSRGAVPGEPSPPSLHELAQQMEDFEHRLHHLKAGIHNLLRLEQTQVDTNAPSPDQQTVQEELRRLQHAVDDFELELASRMIPWPQVREAFWQGVRFGGLGLAVGWLLAQLSCRMS
ncbi:MAG: hypothetical protein ACFCVD_03095 [Nodosilinea sp.]